MATNIMFPHGYVPSPTRGRPIANAQIYIGEPDLDPEIPANQKQISVRQEDGTVVQISQPLRTGSGGVPVFSGSSVTPLVTGNYSYKVLDANGGLIYNISRATGSLAGTTTIILSEQSCDLASAVTNAGSVDPVTIVVDCDAVIPEGTTVTVTSNINLVVNNGGSIDGVAGGSTESLVVNGPFEAGRYTIFGSNVTVSNLSEVFPEWWGAVADGLTDCLSAFNSAMSSLNGGVVRFGEGTYGLSAAATGQSDIIIEGLGESSTLSAIGGAQSSAYSISWSNKNNITVRNIHFDTIGSMSFQTCNNVRVESNIFETIGFGGGIGEVSGGDNIWFIYNYLNTATGMGCTIEGANGGNLTNVHVKENTIINSSDNAIAVRAGLAASVYRVNIVDNIIYNVGRSCIVCNIRSDGTGAGEIVSVVISGNVMEGWGTVNSNYGIQSSVQSSGSIRDVNISNNTMRTLASTTNEIHGINCSQIENLTISSNTITGGVMISGILVNDGKYCSIVGNIIEKAAQDHDNGSIGISGGIALISQDYGNITGNTIRNTGTTQVNRPGIFFQSSHFIQVGQNTVFDDQNTPTQSWGYFQSAAGGGTVQTGDIILSGNLYHGNVEGGEMLGFGINDRAIRVGTVAHVLTAAGAGVTNGTTAGMARTTNSIDYLARGDVVNFPSTNNYWDLTGVSTGANEFKKVLLCIGESGALIVEGNVSENQFIVPLPDMPLNALVAVGFVEIGQNYSGGSLAGNTFHDLWNY